LQLSVDDEHPEDVTVCRVWKLSTFFWGFQVKRTLSIGLYLLS